MGEDARLAKPHPCPSPSQGEGEDNINKSNDANFQQKIADYKTENTSQKRAASRTRFMASAKKQKNKRPKI